MLSGNSLVNKTFNRYRVLGPAPHSNSSPYDMHWICICTCGETRVVRGHNLRRGVSRSCGCLQREKAKIERSRPAFATKEWLVEKYLVEKLNAQEIADIIGNNVWDETVVNWLQKSGIQVRTNREAKGFTKKRGDNHHNYTHGRKTLTNGKVYKCLHLTKEQQASHRCTKLGTCPEHVFMFENYLGRKLKPQEIIHHVNYDKLDNRLDNLILLPNTTAHRALHFHIEKLGAFLSGLIVNLPIYSFPPDAVLGPGAAIPYSVKTSDSNYQKGATS